MPQRHVFQCRHDRRADQPGKACQVFGEHRVALVRHRRGALLPGREEFLGLAQFAALQVADLGGEPLDAGGDHRQGEKELRVPVTRDHLGRDRFGFEAQFFGDVSLDRRVDMGKGADRTRNLAGGDLAARRREPGAVAGEFGIVARKLEAEARRLGMDAVTAADDRRVFVLDGASLQRQEQRLETVEQQVCGGGELDRKSGVEHIARGHALMDETRFRANMFGEVCEKGDDVVPGLALERVDALEVERAALADRARRALGDDAQCRLRVAGMGLDLEPDPEPVLRRPDPRHFGAAIARDHDPPPG